MRRIGQLLVCALLIGAAGCASAPRFPANRLTPTAPVSAAELASGLWSTRPGSLLVRQSALFEFRGMQVPVAGLMKLDPKAKSARLIGMNDMGVKLYDISIDTEGSQANFMVPELSRYPGFAEAVALSVRRIFLTPEPAAGDRLEIAADRYLLNSELPGGASVRFTLGGEWRQLLEKSVAGPAETWRASYYQYAERGGRPFPGGIVLEDDRAGYRLTLWTESVEPTDE